MAQWTNEYAILRDLSVAQGRVPVAIERTLGAGDKPPSLNITEETEEEFFKQGSPDANVSAAPDLGLIQKMLDMVREFNDWSGDEDADNAVVISKPNPHVSEFIPIENNTSTPTNQTPTKQIKKKPKKRQRNIAVESLLQAIAENKSSNEMILRKPDDFMNVEIKPEPASQVSTEPQNLVDILGADNNTSTTPTAAEKVNGWFETQTGNPFPKRTTKVTLEATNIVFKKKEKPKKLEMYPNENLKKLEKSSISSSSNSGEYKPSTLANEYYQKYVERSKFKESFKDDIWSKAERKMKEIDEKRRREAAQTLTSPSSASLVSGFNLSFEDTQSTDTFTERITAETKISRCLDLISLPQHRHRLPGDCIVCEVTRKKPEVPRVETFEEIEDKTESSRSKNKEIENPYSEDLEVANKISESLYPTTLDNAYSNEASSINKENVSEEFENAYSKEIKHEQITNTVNAVTNTNKVVKISDSTEIMPSNLQIADLINRELTKFVENADLNRKVPQYVENTNSVLDFNL